MISLKRIAELERLVEKYESTLHGHSIDAYKEARRVLVNALYEAIPDLLEAARKAVSAAEAADEVEKLFVNERRTTAELQDLLDAERVKLETTRAKYRALEEAARLAPHASYCTSQSSTWNVKPCDCPRKSIVVALDALNEGGE